jgi:hypothetical protein
MQYRERHKMSLEEFFCFKESSPKQIHRSNRVVQRICNEEPTQVGTPHEMHHKM